MYAAYPEKAKREAARIHRHLLPNLTEKQIFNMASCHKEFPGSGGGRPKKRRRY